MIQTFAQKRNLLNKLREYTNLGGMAAENAPFLNNPGFKELMDQLRSTDDQIRSIITGQAIGDASAPNDEMSLKELLKKAKSNHSRREYMTAISFLGRFHDKVGEAANFISKYNADVSSIHEKFLLEGLDDETVEHLHGLKNRFIPKEANRKFSFKKEAGILDFFVNIGTERGRALSAWEKRYPEKVKVLKNETSRMIDKSERIFVIIINCLKEMASFRATRKIDNYIKIADKIVKEFAKYDAEFKSYYENHVKSFINKLPEKIKPVQVEDTKNQSAYRAPAENVNLPNQILSPTSIKSIQNFNPDVESKRPVPNLSELIRNKENQELGQADTERAPFVEMQPSQQKPFAQTMPSPGMPKAKIVAPEIFDSEEDLNDPNADTDPNTLLSPGIIHDPLRSSQLLPPKLPKFEDDNISEAPPIEIPQTKVSNHNFYNTLKSMENEDPIIVKMFVKKYAAKIMTTNPQLAINLLNTLRDIK